MMLKRRGNIYSIFMILLLSAMLTACNSSKKTTTDDVGAAKWDTGNNVGEKWKDGQNQFIADGAMAESENGYYYDKMNSSGAFSVLYFFDKASGKSTVVCDQANCKHNNDKCPAYLPQTFSGLCYYNGYIYYVERDKTWTSHLYQMDNDAHNRKEIMTLCNKNEGISVDLMQFHRDNLFYFVVGDDGNSKLFRIDMVKNDKTLMFETKGKATLAHMKFIENKVYYKFNYTGDDGRMSSTIYQYDINTGETIKIIDGEYSNSYTVTKDYIYYATNYKVKKFDITSGTTSVLLDDVKWAQISNDGMHVYLDVSKNSSDQKIPRKIMVYDWNDRIVDSIEVDDSMSENICYFGGSEYLFLCDIGKELYYFDKTKLGTGEHNWIKSEMIK